MTHLEMLRVDAASNLCKQRLHDLLELLRVDHVQDLLDLVEEHDFLGRVDLWPIPQQTHHDFFRQRGVLFQELNHAIG